MCSPKEANLFSICVFISGGGTTLKNLIDYRQRIDSPAWEISSVVSNNSNAGGLQYAHDAGIETFVVDHREFDSTASFSKAIYDVVRPTNPDLIAMGGFLRRLAVAKDFENRIINIHPSLIPSFCGKGNYGSRVHKAVLDYGCKVTGCTVHFVDDEYDHGPIIAQRAVPVLNDDDAAALAKRVFETECIIYPEVIDSIAQGKVSVNNRVVSVS